MIDRWPAPAEQWRRESGGNHAQSHSHPRRVGAVREPARALGAGGGARSRGAGGRRHVERAAGAHRRGVQRRNRRRTHPRRGDHDRARRPSRLSRSVRLRRQGGRAEDDTRYHLPPLFHDQAAGLGRGDDAGRRGKAPAHRPRRQISPRIQRLAGKRAGDQRARPARLYAGRGDPRADHPGSFAPHRWARLWRDHHQPAGARRLYQKPSQQTRFRLQRHRSRARRFRPRSRRRTARLSAGNGVGI